MKDTSDAKVAAGNRARSTGFVHAVFTFAITLVSGAVFTAVAGLFVYANVADVRSRDGYFTLIVAAGLIGSAVLAYVAARRAHAADPDANNGPAFSLLRKYRRAAAQPGADAQSGQYSIGESYLRELLGRRGA